MSLFLKKFETQAAYTAAESSLALPNVSYIVETNGMAYKPYVDPYNGHAYVDLGLPSGKKWATMNVGASAPEDSGLYFSWGNVEGHAKGSGYDFGTSKDGSRYLYGSTIGATLASDIPVDTVFDMARANMGGNWRLPTKWEFNELYLNTNKEWSTLNGVNGILLTSTNNGNTLFFPSAEIWSGTRLSDDGTEGGYWSSTFLSSYDANCLYFNSDENEFNSQSAYERPYGLNVRGILNS